MVGRNVHIFVECCGKIQHDYLPHSISDMWDAEHERPFSCIDPASASKLLVVRRVGGELLLSGCWIQTTRIKGIMPKGLEVELELLGVKGTATAHSLARLAADMILLTESV